ncbi:MAG: HAD hydrolase-like protein [Burkholderiaceae bacterium]|nr:HAD hydrolase-like protein [Burkholderiaceae bacterium]
MSHASDPRPRVVAFDFDGTLADTYPWVESVLGEVAQTFGFRAPLTRERDALRRLDTRALLRTLGIPLWKAPSIVAEMRRRMQSAAGAIALFPGIESAVDTLAQAGLRLAVVSSNAEDNVRRIIGPQLESRFELFDCGIDLFGKAARLRRLAGHFDVPLHDVMLIGDEVRDIEAARQAGTRVGVTTWGYSSIELLLEHRPDAVFEHAADIPTRLLTP